MSTKGITEADKHANARAYYADIFNAPHWEPTSRHPRMPMEKRAAIFASFDALVGYKEAVTETARTTESKIELSEGEMEELGKRLGIIIDRMEEGTDNGEMPSGIVRAGNTPPTVSITYFVPDQLINPDSEKDGGEYITVTGKVTKIDMYQRMLFFADSADGTAGKIVDLDAVAKFEGELFEGMW